MTTIVSSPLGLAPPTASPPYSPEAEEGPPADFAAGEEGVWANLETDGSSCLPRRICGPLSVVALCRRPEDDDWGCLVDVPRSSGGVNRVVVEADVLTGPPCGIAAALRSGGAEITTDPASEALVAKLIRRWRVGRRVALARACGWCGAGSYLTTGGRSLGTVDTLMPELASATVQAAASRGSFETWRVAVAAKAEGDPLAMLALCQAFAGPLLQPLGLASGGFHLCGGTAVARADLLRIATSVWGGPPLITPWRDAAPAAEALLATRRDSLLALEGLEDAAFADRTKLLRRLRGGSGGFRGSKPLRWRGAILSTGTRPLRDPLARRDASQAADRDVLVDLPLPGLPNQADYSQLDGASPWGALADAATAHGGHAGPRFVEEMLTRLDKTAAMQSILDHFVRAVRLPEGIRTEARTPLVLERFALAALAGTLATRWGITGWQRESAVHALASLANATLRAPGDTLDEGASMQRLRSFLATAGPKLASLAGGGNDETGWQDDRFFYLRPAVWREIHEGLDPIRAARHLKRLGLLHCNSGTLQYRLSRQVPGQPRVYAVSRQVMRPVGETHPPRKAGPALER